MPYSELLIKPMREDLTGAGIEEARTVEQVDAAVNNTTGTLMIVVNSLWMRCRQGATWCG
jgi:putative YphP/YqiW family bacilliredoxin